MNHGIHMITNTGLGCSGDAQIMSHTGSQVGPEGGKLGTGPPFFSAYYTQAQASDSEIRPPNTLPG